MWSASCPVRSGPTNTSSTPRTGITSARTAEGSGDTIFNGAVDNATGTAALIELARAFGEVRPRPERSVVFVGFTGEEYGLLGSEYFADHPVVPLAQIAGGFNMDGMAVNGRTRDVTVVGYGASELEDYLAAAAAEQARVLSRSPPRRKARTIASITSTLRADLFFRLAVCRYQLSSITTALNLLNEALTLAEGSELPCDRLRADILGWRSRCYRRQRDFEAAREDVERALELAQALDDPRKTADTYFQASLVSERMGHWVQARNYAERAKAYYEQINDERNVGRLLNNLGGLNFHLGKPEQAIEHLKDAYRVLLDKGSDAEAANVVASLAHVHLMTGEATAAEEEARHALSLMENRDDFLYHVAPTQLVLGRALMEQGRLDEAEEFLAASDASAEQLESIGHQAAAWMARGDLAAKRGEDGAAAKLYRRAAEALQDVRF